MKNRTFFWFILPSLITMLLFIALPIVSVAVQSVHIEHEAVMFEVENCGPLWILPVETVAGFQEKAVFMVKESHVA